MPIRRRLLQGFGVLASLAGAWSLWRARAERNPSDANTPAAAPAQPAGNWRQTLDRVVDLIAPAEGGPGALALGIPADVVAGLGQQGLTLQTLEQACERLGQLARERFQRDFLALPPNQQAQVLAELLPDTLGAVDAPRVALYRLRERVLQLYLARPETWPAFGLSGAPQPVGFMDYRQAPVRRG